MCAAGALAFFGVTGIAASGCSSGGDDQAATNTTPSADSGTQDGASDAAASQCAPPAVACGASCVEVDSDSANCGACGNRCAAGLTCSQGVCTLFCTGGKVKCGDVCVDTQRHPANCGACGTQCAADHVCTDGECKLSCKVGDLECGGHCADVQVDPSDCGACGKQCPATAPTCIGGACINPLDCTEIKQIDPAAPSGSYMIAPDGPLGLAPFSVWCDMVTDGGGWSIVFAHSGADNEPGLVSDAEAAGNALNFEYMNLNRAKKMALAAISTESILVRKDSRWLKADKTLFDNHLDDGDTDTSFSVKLTAKDGAVADGFIGWSNHQITGGGDFGISMSPDGATCGGDTVDGFDHHSTLFQQLNCSCQRQYLYSKSDGAPDGDAAYNVNTSLGDWTATAACSGAEGGGFSFYAAMRRLVGP